MHIINMRPPRIAMALTLIAALIHWSFKLWEPARLSLPLTGVSIGTGGFILMMWSWWLFKQQNLAICPLATTAHITKTGPYRISRNPMYLGMVFMLSGLALYVGTLPFYLSAIGYYVILNVVFVPYEENKLTNAFGSAYREYKVRVRRWV